MATLRGTNGNDRLVNISYSNKTIIGLLGNDYLQKRAWADDLIYGDDVAPSARDGNDTVYAGGGKDTVYGGGGRDWVDGGLGEDKLYGQAGADSLYGGSQDDTLVGGADADYLNGGHYDDLIYGDETVNSAAGSNDTIDGYYGDDTIYGGGGNDLINAGSNHDVVYGGHGNDTIIGGGGKDILYGNDGADVFRYPDKLDSFPGYRNLNVDVIKDFNVAQGDKIDLRAIDANSNVAGDQAFGFASGPGQGVVWTERVGSDLFVKADIANSYVNAAFMIELDNFSGTLSASSFLL